jgi:hypothetical protein
MNEVDKKAKSLMLSFYNDKESCVNYCKGIIRMGPSFSTRNWDEKRLFWKDVIDKLEETK